MYLVNLDVCTNLGQAGAPWARGLMSDGGLICTLATGLAPDLHKMWQERTSPLRAYMTNSEVRRLIFSGSKYLVKNKSKQFDFNCLNWCAPKNRPFSGKIFFWLWFKIFYLSFRQPPGNQVGHFLIFFAENFLTMF